MDIHEAVKRLDGGEYGKEGSRELFAEMKAAGLVAVFGASDDLMEFRGAVDDEVGAYDGGTALFTPAGLFTNECGEDDCPYHARLAKEAAEVNAIWVGDEISWRFETDIPHAKFTINEDGEPYCEGIVFALADALPSLPSPMVEQIAQQQQGKAGEREADITSPEFWNGQQADWLQQRDTEKDADWIDRLRRHFASSAQAPDKADARDELLHVRAAFDRWFEATGLDASHRGLTACAYHAGYAVGTSPTLSASLTKGGV